MILPGATIGILGGGQLGRMLAVTARQHGYGVIVLAPEGDAPAAGVADRWLRASYEDTGAARALAEASAVVTYEFENVSADTVAAIAARTETAPSAELLAITQDRIAEHAFLHRNGVATAPGAAVHSMGDLFAAVLAHGLPGRIKSARGGYDGGGQHRLQDLHDVHAQAERLKEGAWLYERDVAFEREFSVIVCRNAGGDVMTFPCFENVHHDGILAETTWPARVPGAVAARGEEVARTLADAVRLVGTLTVECFEVDGDVRVNELAPRVHNSGHLTIEGCTVSQFEQHLRAICGLPLRLPEARAPGVAMVNLLGSENRRRVQLDGADAAMAVPGAHVHLYGKSTVRPRRKMGHVTALGTSREDALERARRAHGALSFGA